ncbi:uncharacterized protein LOC112569641 isoform X2 [Pomacea canaliculata]|uniref:uncharacterized protein LOC112569641 isoform X2 n=1 Tax=Pomacea canaliculata TaxID=400727 RepID=UPI000D72D128|nr:uncharacterized protein LOC112569641 isoform X2 [Pomacea canaliculata]
MQKHLLSLLLCLLLLLQKMHSSRGFNCPLLEFLNFNLDTLSVPESSFVNLTFWLNDSGCKKSDFNYRVEVQTKLDMGSWEYDGRIFQTNHCTEVTSTSVGCLSAAGPARLYKVLNRSHEEIEWTWTWKDSGDIKTMEKGLKLYVLYPPSVKTLTVDGHEVNGTYLINEGQRVNISCSFEKGRPPAVVRLLVKNRTTLQTVSSQEGNLNKSFVFHCADDWPIVSCEGSGSTFNRSVSFLVRCPPRFVKESVKIVSSSVYEDVELDVKAYTTAVTGCVLTSLSSHKNTQRQINCSLSGSPPDLVLNFRLDNNDSNIKEWILTLLSERGSASITLSPRKDSSFDDQRFKGCTTLSSYSTMEISLLPSCPMND